MGLGKHQHLGWNSMEFKYDHHNNGILYVGHYLNFVSRVNSLTLLILTVSGLVCIQ